MEKPVRKFSSPVVSPQSVLSTANGTHPNRLTVTRAKDTKRWRNRTSPRRQRPPTDDDDVLSPRRRRRQPSARTRTERARRKAPRAAPPFLPHGVSAPTPHRTIAHPRAPPLTQASGNGTGPRAHPDFPARRRRDMMMRSKPSGQVAVACALRKYTTTPQR